MTDIAKRPGLFRQMRRRKNKGLALFDVILAVGVIGFLIAGGVLLLQTVQERIKRNDTVALVNQIRAEAQRIFAGQPTFDGLTMNALEVRGSLPDYVIRTPGSVWKSAYDGVVNVWPESGLKQFTIGIGGLDKGPCADIMTPYTKKTRTVSGLVAMGVGIETVAGALTARAWTAAFLPLTGASGAASGAGIAFATASGWCTGGDGLNSVYFRFQG